MAERLTQAGVDAWLRSDGKALKDPETKGLELRRYPSGKASWSFRYRTRTDGKQRRATIGEAGLRGFSLRQARDRADELKSQVRDHRDPVAEQKAGSGKRTFGELIEIYLKACTKRELRPATLQAYNHFLGLPEVRALYDRPADSITHGVLNDLIETVRDTKGVRTGKKRVATARSLRTYLHGMYEWALDHDKVAESPFYSGRVRSAVKYLSGDNRPKKRDRTPSGDELRDILDALKKQPQPYADIVTVLILAGLRRKDVAEAWVDNNDGDCDKFDPKHDKFNFDHKVWTIPGRRMKNHKMHRVPLTDELIQILKPRVDALPPSGGYVFATKRGKKLTAFGLAKERLDRDSRVTGWRHHDLRRSIGSLMPQELEIPVHVANAILAHSGARAANTTVGDTRSDPILGTYMTATFFEARRKAMIAWAAWLHSDNDPETNVKQLSDYR
jgi:integrase